MASIVDKLIAAHPDTQFVCATTKREVLSTLDAMRHVIEAMEDFTQFPEGANGAVLFALLNNASASCPDVGDFNDQHQGCQAALNTAFEVLHRELDWFPGGNSRQQ